MHFVWDWHLQHDSTVTLFAPYFENGCSIGHWIAPAGRDAATPSTELLDVSLTENHINIYLGIDFGRKDGISFIITDKNLLKLSQLLSVVILHEVHWVFRVSPAGKGTLGQQKLSVVAPFTSCCAKGLSSGHVAEKGWISTDASQVRLWISLI